jgi:bacillithiol system protein YtxJ
MGFFSRIKDSFSMENNVSEHWNHPENENDLDQILSRSNKIQVIFKHSSACGTSAFALRSMESILPESVENVDFHIVEVRIQRDLSNYVAQITGVRHESPQLILVKNGEVLWDASHSAIFPKSVLEKIGQFR